MPAKRRKFSWQFKAEAVRLVVERDRPIAEVARELAINETTLGNWVKAWRAGHPEPEPEQSPVERARVAEMEDELRRLRMENEFLKKVPMAALATPPRQPENRGWLSGGRRRCLVL